MALAAALTLGACTTKESQQERIQHVKVMTVTDGTYQGALQYPGRVKAQEDISLSFKVSGSIASITVKEGQRVQKGQVLAQMDQTDYQVQMDATEAEYKQIKAECERVIKLYEENSVSANDYDKAVYGLKQITAKYQHAKDQLEYTTLRAPFDGYIQKRYFQDHEIVSAGLPVLSLISTGVPEVEINLPASEYIKRESFRDYTCSFDIYPGRTYHLDYISCTPSANANQLYTMRLRMRQGDGPMPALGISTMVSIGLHSDGDSQMRVPSSAVFEKDGSSKVFRINEDNRVSAVGVTIEQLMGNGECVISSSELSNGERIVSAGVHHIQEGEKVEPFQEPSASNVGGLM